MIDFFKGWRRRAGCVTFAMALAVVAMLARSYPAYDMVGFHVGGRQYMLQSIQGFVKWSGWIPRDDEPLVSTWESLYPNDDQFRGILVRQMGINGHDKSADWVVSYWLMIIPLLVLSAYLILWKSRIPY